MATGGIDESQNDNDGSVTAMTTTPTTTTTNGRKIEMRWGKKEKAHDA